MDPLAATALSAWTPIRVSTMSPDPVVEWALVDEPYADAFFEVTADRAMQHPFNQIFGRSTGLAAVSAVHAASPGIVPTGFIFHMSRSGSTLIAQMLARLSSTIVLSEPQPLDALLALRRRVPNVDDETMIGLLRAMLSALARPRGAERRLFVKFHAWHVLELPLIARTFPTVPWVFVFREPRAVLRSQRRAPGAELLAGTIDPRYLGIDADAARAAAADDYAARVLAAFCEAALAHAGAGRALFMDYAALPERVFSSLLPFFGIAPDDDESTRMRETAQLDAKSPGTPFRPRRNESEPEIERVSVRWLDAPFSRLRAEAARTRSWESWGVQQ
jgi:hypothetical protein